MMQKVWNEKFSRDGYLYGKAPNRFLSEAIDSLERPSSILFLGEGEGRNACYAAMKGHDALALDASDVGLQKASALSSELGVEIKTLHIDLGHWVPEVHYDAVMASFLHLKEPLRSLAFQKAFDALKPSGVFVAEFFSLKQLPLESGGPKDPDLLYTVEALRAIFEAGDDLSIRMLEESVAPLDEGRGHQGDAELIRVIVEKS